MGATITNKLKDAIGDIKKEIDRIEGGIAELERERDFLKYSPRPNDELRKIALQKLDKAITEAAITIDARLLSQLESMRLNGLERRRHIDGAGNPVGALTTHEHEFENPFILLRDGQASISANALLYFCQDLVKGQIVSLIDEGQQWIKPAGPAMEERFSRLEKVEADLASLCAQRDELQSDLKSIQSAKLEDPKLKRRGASVAEVENEHD